MNTKPFIDDLVRALHKATGGVDSTSVDALDCRSCRERVNAMWPVMVNGVAEWIEHQGQVEGEILPIEASSLASKLRTEWGA